MQVTINPNIYGAVADQKLPDVVVSLLGAAGGQLADDDLNGRRAYRRFTLKKTVRPVVMTREEFFEKVVNQADNGNI
jgi:hypothetical protein